MTTESKIEKEPRPIEELYQLYILGNGFDGLTPIECQMLNNYLVQIAVKDATFAARSEADHGLMQKRAEAEAQIQREAERAMRVIGENLPEYARVIFDEQKES